MINIDEYIEKAKSLPNTSDGGNIIGDKVLVCYEIPNKYGIARENEEKIADAINKKADEGVRTPRHLAVKRETVGDRNYCWVLQEKAHGLSYTRHCNSDNALDRLHYSCVMASAPQSHFDKYISDIIELFYFGIELKSKNIFYDEEEGFTIIDFLEDGSKGVFDKSSIRDIHDLWNWTHSITGCCLSSYMKKVTQEELDASNELYGIIKLKLFMAIKNNIPDFHKYERWLLRCLDSNLLYSFKKNGYNFEPLVLNNQEIDEFHQLTDKIVEECIEKIKSGKYKLWQIEVNEIRNSLNQYGLTNSWKYSPENTRDRNDRPDYLEPDEEYSDYDYECRCEKDLEGIVLDKFCERLLNENSLGNNEYVNEVCKELEAKKAKNIL